MGRMLPQETSLETFPGVLLSLASASPPSGEVQLLLLALQEP